MRPFADDTWLTASNINIGELLLLINFGQPNTLFYKWLCTNKLTLHLKKTKYVDYNLLRPLMLAD